LLAKFFSFLGLQRQCVQCTFYHSLTHLIRRGGGRICGAPCAFCAAGDSPESYHRELLATLIWSYSNRFHFNGIGTFHRVVNHNLHASTVSGTVERRDISPFGIYMGPSWVCDVEDEIQVVRRVGVGMSVQTNLCPTPKIVCRMQAYCTYQLQILVSAVQFACWE